MEKEIAEFLCAQAFRVTEKEVSKALQETIRVAREEYDGRIQARGLFFKLLLDSLGRSVDWSLCEALEEKFLERHRASWEKRFSLTSSRSKVG
ncbi:MAG: hypothetical protein HYY37_04095 [Candidatus Aenigmarchaeota archaeon]|nr:hypothetical protein [Candidatus Aenigmarchaeota archaeon]